MARLNYRVQIEFYTDAANPTEAATRLEELSKFGTVAIKSVTQKRDRRKETANDEADGNTDQPEKRRAGGFFNRG